MKKIITATELYNELIQLQLEKYTGKMTFEMAGLSVHIITTDIVGYILQSWLKQYLISKDIFFIEPANTQSFPDFFLNDIHPENSMLEIKSFHYSELPGFDIANFESYCNALHSQIYILDADYLIFGYNMNKNGSISISKIWLQKIWEIAGISKQYALKTQIKRGMIYNIRPNSNFKFDKPSPFQSREDFLKAIYETLKKYKNEDIANEWKKKLAIEYEQYYHKKLLFQ